MKDTTKINIVDISDAKNYDKKIWDSSEILIFSDEWILRKRQCENFIKSKNKIHDKKIHGRKCEVKEINTCTGKQFLDDHHIQGSNNLHVVFFGLFYENQLIGVMSLGRHSRQISENRIVLDRFCVAYGIHVQGGATKLFSKCVIWAKARKYDQIISFSDNRWTDGNIYEVLGFDLEKNYRPDYCYVDTKNPDRRLSKQSQKKSSVKCPNGMTEFEWAELRGLKRLWDLGKKRWVYNLDPNFLTWKQMLSSKCANQNKNGDFKHSHIRGYFKSNKCKCEIYYGSSYELRCIFLLENNPEVKFFKRADVFIDSIGGYRNPDLHVEYLNGKIQILEIKPETLINHDGPKKQIEETRLYAKQKGIDFYVWSEKDSELTNEKSIVNWAKKFIAETTGNIDWIEKQKNNNRIKAKNFYNKNIASDKVEVYCEFCKETHTPLKLTYEKNMFRNNGNYICEKHGGFIAGSKPKKKKENPYSSEGKKQCNKCLEIKLFEEFGDDKTKLDGKATRCKICRAKSATEKYQNRIKD